LDLLLDLGFFRRCSEWVRPCNREKKGDYIEALLGLKFVADGTFRSPRVDVVVMALEKFFGGLARFAPGPWGGSEERYRPGDFSERSILRSLGTPLEGIVDLLNQRVDVSWGSLGSLGPRARPDLWTGRGEARRPALGYGARIRGSVERHESLDQGPEALDPSSSGEPVPWEDSDEDSDGDSNEDSSDPGPFGPVVRRERPFEGRVAYVPFEDRVAYVAYVGLDPLPGDLGTPGRLRAPGTASSRSTTAGASAPVSETSSTWDPETSSIWDPEDPGGDRGGREPTRDLSGGDGPVTRDRTETRDFEGSRAWDFAVPVPVTGLEYPD